MSELCPIYKLGKDSVETLGGEPFLPENPPEDIATPDEEREFELIERERTKCHS